MTIWYKQGVCGDLNRECQKCIGRIQKIHPVADIKITAIRDGNHMAGSFHYIGDAFDLQKVFTLKEIKKAAGPGFDVIEHKFHYHVEYDPK